MNRLLSLSLRSLLVVCSTLPTATAEQAPRTATIRAELKNCPTNREIQS